MSKSGDLTREDERVVLLFLNQADDPEQVAGAVDVPGKRDVGIGIAKRILRAREERGGFTELSQLRDVDGVGPDMFRGIVSSLTGSRGSVAMLNAAIPRAERALGERATARYLAGCVGVLDAMVRLERPVFPLVVYGSLRGTTGSSKEGADEDEELEVVGIDDVDAFNAATEGCEEFTFTLYADQPLAGDRTPYHDGDVGHSFIQIEGCGESFTLGFYPREGYGWTDFVSGSYDDDRGGELVNDAEHHWDAKKTWSVTREQVEKVKEFIREWNEEARYNLVTRNCTDFAIEAGKAAGLDVPSGKQTSWPEPYDDVTSANPGDLGEDLVRDGGERQ